MSGVNPSPRPTPRPAPGDCSRSIKADKKCNRSGKERKNEEGEGGRGVPSRTHRPPVAKGKTIYTSIDNEHPGKGRRRRGERTTCRGKTNRGVVRREKSSQDSLRGAKSKKHDVFKKTKKGSFGFRFGFRRGEPPKKYTRYVHAYYRYRS